MDSWLSPQEIFKELDCLPSQVPIIVLTSPEDSLALSKYVIEEGAASVLERGQFSLLVKAVKQACIE